MKIMFIRPPRYRWPFHSEKSSFWQPIGFASMAAVLRENIPGLNIEIIDCPVLEAGWKTTKKIVKALKPDVVCVGEETVSAHEALRLISFVKKDLQDCITIAGGMHFTYMAEHALKNYPLDYIVRFEGELTLLELIHNLKKDTKPSLKRLKKIKGIAFMHSGRLCITEPRQLIDMEKLPMPAYDLLPMDLYGKEARSHKDLVAIEHSRGCSSSCNFCTLWKQMGKPEKENIMPCYRTKSPEKTVEEIKYLVKNYKRKTFCWVDPTFNISSSWNEKFADLLIKEGLKIDHSAWMRADCIVRDEKLGIFKKQVKAGLKQVMVGIERTDNDDLDYLDKSGYSFFTTKRSFEILRKYPQVLSVATYIYGLPNETRRSLKRFYKQLNSIPFDFGIPIPLTPNPGTKYFDDPEYRDLIEVKSFRHYNFISPVARSKYLSRHQLAFWRFYYDIKNEIIEYLKSRNVREKRRKTAIKNLSISKLLSITKVTASVLSEILLRKKINTNIRPRWYER